jgi:hypothetical protein
MQLDQYGSFNAIKLIVIFYQLINHKKKKKKKKKKTSKILPSVSCSGPTFSSLDTLVSTYKAVTPNHWKKCIYALGLVFRLRVLNLEAVSFFAKPTKALIVMKNFNVGRLPLSAWSVRQFNKHMLFI